MPTVNVSLRIVFQIRAWNLTTWEDIMELTKDITKELKGIAIILVIIGHLNFIRYVNILPKSIYNIADWGVAAFLLMSGFGLASSYLKNGLNNYFLKRFSKVYFPYLLVTLIFLHIYVLKFHQLFPKKVILMNLLAIDLNYSFGDGTMWFMSYILMWYVIFYAVFKLPMKNIFKIGLMFGAALMFRYNLFSFAEPSAYVLRFRLYAFMLPAGVVLGIYWSKIKDFKKLTMIIGIISIIILAYFGRLSGFDNSQEFRNLTISCFAFAIGLTSLLLVKNFKLKILAFIGNISLEIYFLEMKLMLQYSLLRFNNKLVSIFFYSVVLLILSYLLSLFLKAVRNRFPSYSISININKLHQKA